MTCNTCSYKETYLLVRNVMSKDCKKHLAKHESDTTVKEVAKHDRRHVLNGFSSRSAAFIRPVLVNPNF